MKTFLLFIFLFILGCTNGVPNTSKIFSETGFYMMKSEFIVNNLNPLEAFGTCNPEYPNILVKINGKSWENVSEILDTTKTIDIDCSNSDFHFFIDPVKIGLFFGDTVLLSLKQLDLDNNSTQESIIRIEYFNHLKAEILNVPPKTGSSLSLLVEGNSPKFRYKLGEDCKNINGYSSSLTIGNLNLDLSSVPEGKNKLCILGDDPTYGIQSINSPSEYVFILDRTPPSNIEIQNKPNLNDNRDSFEITVVSESAVKYSIKKVLNLDDCNINSGFVDKDINQNYSFSIPNLDKNQINHLCVYTIDDVSNKSSTIVYSWTHDDINPPLLTGNLSYTITNNYIETPTININSNANTGSPYSKFKIKISKDLYSNTIIDWSEFLYESPLIKFSSLILEEGTYKVYAILEDSAGNEGPISHIGDWIVDITQPSININYPYPTLSHNNYSKTFKLNFSDSSGISLSQAWLLNNDLSIHSGPISIFNETEFFFNTPLIKNKNYILLVKITDFAGNQKVDYVSNFNSRNCVNSNPNNVNEIANICSDVPLDNSIIGWKMQGGIIIGNNGSNIIVSPENPMTESILDIWGFGFLSTTDISKVDDPVPAFPRTIPGSTAYNHCRVKNISGLNDWFLPSKTEMIRLVCAAGLETCGSPVVISLLNTVNYWTISENSLTLAISYHPADQLFHYDNKASYRQITCVRSFSN